MTLTLKQLSLVPTQHGFLFLGILFAMLLGSINYNNNAGFILVFLLGSMAVISLVHSYKNLLGITIFFGQPCPVFAGQKAFFPVTITAPKGAGQALVLFFSPGTAPAEAVNLPLNHLPFETRARGLHRPGHLVLTSVFPFGLFRLKARIPVGKEVLVYPAPAPGSVSPLAAGGQGEGQEESAFNGPDDFQGLFPYVPGSPVGHISWKTLSRGKGLLIKKFFAEQGGEQVFDLENIQGRDLETRLSNLCHALLEAQKRQVPFGLKLASTVLEPPATGQAHLHRCLTALALHRRPPPGPEAL